MENWIVGIVTGIISGLISGWVVYLITKNIDDKKLRNIELKNYRDSISDYLWMVSLIIEQSIGYKQMLKNNVTFIANLPYMPDGRKDELSELEKEALSEIMKAREELMKIVKSDKEADEYELLPLKVEFQRLNVNWIIEKTGNKIEKGSL